MPAYAGQCTLIGSFRSMPFLSRFLSFLSTRLWSQMNELAHINVARAMRVRSGPCLHHVMSIAVSSSVSRCRLFFSRRRTNRSKTSASPLKTSNTSGERDKLASEFDKKGIPKNQNQFDTSMADVSTPVQKPRNKTEKTSASARVPLEVIMIQSIIPKRLYPKPNSRELDWRTK